jgi:hypothetical protein
VPKPPVVSRSIGDCFPEPGSAWIVVLADGSVLANQTCYARWPRGSPSGMVERPVGGAVGGVVRESQSSAIAFGADRDHAVYARWNGKAWTRLVTTQLDPVSIARKVGRTADGTIWTVVDRRDGPTSLWRQRPGKSQWEQLEEPAPGAAGSSAILNLEVVEGELWVQVLDAWLTTRPVAKVLRLAPPTQR